MFLLCNAKAQTSKESASLTYDLIINGIYYNVISINDLTLCAVGRVDTTATTLKVPGTVEYGGRVFSVPKVDMQNSCSTVRTLILPNNLEYLHIDGCDVEELHLSAKVISGFHHCPRLRRLSISANTEQIRPSTDMPFSNCNLDKLVFEDGYTILRFIRYGFDDSLIDSVYCGRNFEEIGNYDDTYFTMNGFRGVINAISFGSFVNRIEGMMIFNVKSLDIPENIIEIYGRVYNGFGRLEEINIFSKNAHFVNAGSVNRSMLSNIPTLSKVYINTIENYGFINEMGCEELVIGRDITNLYGNNDISVTGNNAMVKVLNRTPPRAPQFTNETYLYTPLYVPSGSLSVYQTADGWRNFFNIVEFDWDEPNYTISATANNSEYGTIEGTGTYHSGESIALTATPNNGCFFRNWTENGVEVSTNRIYTFVVDRDRTLIANFKLGNSVSINVTSNNSESGTVEGAGNYSCGETVILRAIPNSSNSFQNWTENGSVVCSQTTYSFVAENDRNLMANFRSLSVDENEVSSRVFAFAKDRSIMVEGSDTSSEITVYTIQGQFIYKGLEKKIPVPSAGLYIVAVGNRKIKVVVE